MIKLLNKKLINKQLKIAVIGLGYVGLPIAKAFSKYFEVIGFDLDQNRILELNKNFDRNEITKIKRIINKKIKFTNKLKDIKNCDIFIITVPTPIKKNNIPDLNYLDKAIFDLISLNLKNKFIIIESTIYPTLCAKYISIIANKTKLKINKDFYLGFSPERINPGDNTFTLKNIDKIVSSSSLISVEFLKKLYSKIINNVHISKSIEEAEMAKVIENTQRDINIAFINEISLICHKLNLNFNNVIKLASTKWNFLKFEPGLVGGHCISVDPYYLTYILKKKKYKPKVILSGRYLNENYSKNLVKIFKKKFRSSKVKILIAGLTYKEDCNDIRNSKAFDLAKNLKKFYHNVNLFDPHLKNNKIYNLKLTKKPKFNYYDFIIMCVRHKKFYKNSQLTLKLYGNKNHIIYDVKSGGYLV